MKSFVLGLGVLIFLAACAKNGGSGIVGTNPGPNISNCSIEIDLTSNATAARSGYQFSANCHLSEAEFLERILNF